VLEAHIAFHCTNTLCVHHVTCHLCALQIQKLSEHKGAISPMAPLCSHFLPSLGQNWTCHQSVCVPVLHQNSRKKPKNFRVPERPGWLILVKWHQKV